MEDRDGILKRINGGSLYLDEITEVPPRLQAKVLRVLEEKTIRPLGGDVNESVDFRLLTSSRQPAEVLEAGALVRRDLYCRWNAETIEIPPLRERLEDLPLLIEEILGDLSAQAGVQVPYVNDDVVELWQHYHWPGNVRELENELQRLLLEEPHEIKREALRLVSPRAAAPPSTAWANGLPTLRAARLETERTLVEAALRRRRGNVTAAAKDLGVTRRYLTALVEKHHVQRPAPKGEQTEG